MRFPGAQLPRKPEVFIGGKCPEDFFHGQLVGGLLGWPAGWIAA